MALLASALWPVDFVLGVGFPLRSLAWLIPSWSCHVWVSYVASAVPCWSSDSTLVYSLLSLRLISDRHLGISTQICPWQLTCKYPIGFSVPLPILCPHKILAFAQSLKSSIWKSCWEFLPHHSHPADHWFLQVMPALFCSLSSYPSP